MISPRCHLDCGRRHQASPSQFGWSSRAKPFVSERVSPEQPAPELFTTGVTWVAASVAVMSVVREPLVLGICGRRACLVAAPWLSHRRRETHHADAITVALRERRRRMWRMEGMTDIGKENGQWLQKGVGGSLVSHPSRSIRSCPPLPFSGSCGHPIRYLF